MLSHQYIIRLQMIEKTLSLRVYSDRSTEIGCIDSTGQFYPSLDNGEIHSRRAVTQILRMARDFGYDIERVNL